MSVAHGILALSTRKGGNAMKSVFAVILGYNVVALFDTFEKAVLFANDEPWYNVQEMEVE
jgi:hypothetical protein